MRHLFQPGSWNTSSITKCSTPLFRRRSTNTVADEFTPPNSIGENVSSTATIEQDAGKTKISIVSCAEPSGQSQLLPELRQRPRPHEEAGPDDISRKRPNRRWRCLLPAQRLIYRGFLLRSPAGRTVVAGVFAPAAGFWETPGAGVVAGRLEFSLVITESLKS